MPFWRLGEQAPRREATNSETKNKYVYFSLKINGEIYPNIFSNSNQTFSYLGRIFSPQTLTFNVNRNWLKGQTF